MQILNVFLKFDIPTEKGQYSVRIQFFLQMLTHLRLLEFHALIPVTHMHIYIYNLLELWF